MIPRAYITEWQKNVPWQTNAQVEQDLIIERALVELFSDDFIKESLAFRGGTALHKIFLKPQVRYSEDIDLVQIKKGEIGDVLTRIREKLSFIERTARHKPSRNNNTLTFRYNSEIEPIQPMRLKIEINCREHFSVFDWNLVNHKVESTYFQGEATVTSYRLEEILGTKLRALYQRKKGRDLFDLYYALRMAKPDNDEILLCYRKYMTFTNERPASTREFLLNMGEKMQDATFLGDMTALVRPEVEFNMEEAYELVKNELIEKI